MAVFLNPISDWYRGSYALFCSSLGCRIFSIQTGLIVYIAIFSGRYTYTYSSTLIYISTIVFRISIVNLPVVVVDWSSFSVQTTPNSIVFLYTIVWYFSPLANKSILILEWHKLHLIKNKLTFSVYYFTSRVYKIRGFYLILRC